MTEILKLVVDNDGFVEGENEQAVLETLYDTNFRQPAESLRKVAQQIEDGEFGPVGTVALVLLGNTMEIFGFGPDSDGCSVACLLQAGNLRMVTQIAKHGREEVSP